MTSISILIDGIFVNRKQLGSSQLMVRGLSTLQGPKSPLIILDNFPYEGDVANINPNDVENITILKDAAAASIWGAKAGNGVIVITTKKGVKSKRVAININSNITFLQKPDLFYIPQISSSDFIDVETFLYDEGYYNNQIASSSKPPLSPVVELLIKKSNGSITSAEADQQINALRSLDVRNDFNRYMYSTGVNRQYHIDAGSGTEIYTWLIAANLDKNKDQLSAEYQKINLRSENLLHPFKNLTVTAGLYYTQSESVSGKPGYNDVTTTNGRIPPYTRFANDAGAAIAVIKNYRQAYLDTAGNGKLLDWNYYPLTDYTHSRKTIALQDVLINVGADYKITRWLTANVKYQYDRHRKP
ncbi:MAG: TonB-dependent receptor plug domain-containing protein [Niabella sp.]